MPLGQAVGVRGQTLVEYGLIIAMVAVICVVSLLLFRPEISSVLSDLSATV
jgi:Flp pilus assembly pilin Flp